MGVMSCPVPATEMQGCAAMRMWRNACNTLVAPDADDAWNKVVQSSPPDSLWHSLRNCVAYQAGIWQNLLNKGIDDVIQPAAFKLAIVLRHTPSELAVKLLCDLLRQHPQSQDLTSYILALLTDDEAQWCGHCSSDSSNPSSPSSTAESSQSGTTDRSNKSRESERAESESAESETSVKSVEPAVGAGDRVNAENAENVDSADAELGEARASTPVNAETPAGPAPLRDLQLFGDCELAVLAARREEYDAHAKLVRAEYSKLTNEHYVELRIKVLNQFSQIPKLYHTPEFECFESAARENIDREICTLREHLKGKKE